METSQLYIVRYYDPALSYLSRIGALMHETMRRFHNQLIRYDDIDKMVAQLEEAQDTIIAQNPRLKRMKIDRHDHSDHVVIIDTPVKNNDPEELFRIEPITGYLYGCLDTKEMSNIDDRNSKKESKK